MRFLLAFMAVLTLPAPAFAETYEVKMLNRNATGAMVYEPDYLKVAPGDRVKFVAAKKGHNAASIDGMLPAGAQPFKGQINEEIEVTLTEPGVYGVKCSPHFAMGMVMLIVVGQNDARIAELPGDLPRRARQRFEEILERAGRPES